ncbi:MAG: Asp-tRNA(Asn)/Glu-tRNA(Gln) amidotransferase subunit GatA [Phycisphaerae bacterium]|nr:Asp-tRNA(Asn)/Glu-tRNA(Gln) amidotransferase subunit GatA [Phycisphaerae bacterium]
MSAASDLTILTAAELAKAIVTGEASATAAIEAYLAAIDARDGAIGAYNEVFADRARARATSVDAGEITGPLAGVPIAVKDNMCTTYGRTTCASTYLATFEAPYDCTAVANLEAAGAVVLGKTNMDEFAMGSSTENSSTRMTRNPWDTDRVPGGSSGGSAAAVAAHLCAAALGSDTGGSIRQPAALCGIVGLKPTYGRVSRYGLVAFGSSLDQIGPMTRDVADAALLTRIIAGHDDRDATSLSEDVPDYAADLASGAAGLRIGLPTEFYTDALGGEVRSVIDQAIETYRAAGAETVEVSLPHSRIDIDADGKLSSFAVAAYYIICTAECSSNLARFDGVHYGHRTEEKVEDIIELYSRSRAESLGEEVKRRIMLGNYALSSGYYDAYYNKALKVRRLIANDFAAAFKHCDVILCATTPTPAFRIGEKTDDPLEMYLADIYTNSLNLAGLPGMSLPGGLSSDGLPVGIQLIGPVLGEPTLFRAGRAFEAASGTSRLTSPVIEGQS